jgi:hypothetical protein
MQHVFSSAVPEHAAVAQYMLDVRILPAGHVIVEQSACAEQQADCEFSPRTVPYFAGSLKVPVTHVTQDARHLCWSFSQQIGSSVTAAHVAAAQ